MSIRLPTLLCRRPHLGAGSLFRSNRLRVRLRDRPPVRSARRVALESPGWAPDPTSGISMLFGGVSDRFVAAGRLKCQQVVSSLIQGEQTSNVEPSRPSEHVYQRRQHHCPTGSKPGARCVELRSLTQTQQIISRQKILDVFPQILIHSPRAKNQMQLGPQNSTQRHDGSSFGLSRNAPRGGSLPH